MELNNPWWNKCLTNIARSNASAVTYMCFSLLSLIIFNKMAILRKILISAHISILPMLYITAFDLYGLVIQVAQIHWHCTAMFPSYTNGLNINLLNPYTDPVHWNATGMPLIDLVYTGIPMGASANIAGYTGTPLEKLSWNCPALECHRRFDHCSLHWNTTGGTITAPHTPQAHIVKQSSIHASLNDKMAGHQAASGHVCIFSFFLGVYCSAMAISSALQTCEYFNITLCMPWIWAPL